MRVTKKNLLLEHLAARPDRYLPTGEEIDQIIGGTMPDHDVIIVHRHEWFDDFLPALNWFRMLSDLALEGHNPKEFEFTDGPNPMFAGQRRELSRLLTEVLVAFGPAHQESSAYSADWLLNRNATIEMLKRYRLYTRYVEQFTLEVFPTLDPELLLHPDFPDHPNKGR